jgi:hypothetical protein
MLNPPARLAFLTLSLACLLNATPVSATHKDTSDLGTATIEVAFSPGIGATDLVVKAIGERPAASRARPAFHAGSPKVLDPFRPLTLPLAISASASPIEIPHLSRTTCVLRK